MNTKTLLLSFLLCSLLLPPAFSQQFPEKALQQIAKEVQKVQARAGGGFLQLPLCTPDSVLRFAFTFPSDSTLSERLVYRIYGEEAVAIFTYQLDPPLLLSTDSSVYDASGRLVFNEQWDYDEFEEELVFSGRTVNFPRGATTLNDSIIEYALDWSSQQIQPDIKTVFTYGMNDRLEETEEFAWSGSYSPESKDIYFYDGEGKIENVESYTWTGSGYTLEYNTDYTYDSNDSLITTLQTEAATGTPSVKTEYTYDPAAHSTLVEISFWDSDNNEWLLFLYVLVDLDEDGRTEMTETGIIFIFVLGARAEFTYSGNSPCPWFSTAYTSEDFQNWVFDGKAYYFPNSISSTSAVVSIPWQVLPNPASGEIWVSTPEGETAFSRFALVNMLGQTAMEGVFHAPSTRIDVSGLQAGPYTLMLSGQQGIAAKQVIVR